LSSDPIAPEDEMALAAKLPQAAVQVGVSGHVVGVDFTDEQLGKATRLRDRDGFTRPSSSKLASTLSRSGGASFDAVISNGVINLSPVKHRVLAEAARVLRPGGRLAIADIVSGRPLKERTRRNVELWAACIAGAIPRNSYLSTLETAGFRVGEGAHQRLRLHFRTRPQCLQYLRRREHLDRNSA
jgi:arsenite methyltransferase